MSDIFYDGILASALELLGERVVVHWKDDKGEACGIAGTLHRIDPAHIDPGTKKERGKTLVVGRPYACIEVASVTFIERL